MTKAPIFGKVKIRLASEIGEKQATDLYKCFILDILEKLSKVSADIIIHYTPEEAIEDLKKLFGESYIYIPQKGYNLGERLYNGLEITKESGYKYAIALASDIPDIPEDYLIKSALFLGKFTAIIGPSTDGGYNLIGFDLKYNDISFFSEIEWGTTHVFMDTMERINHLSVCVLDSWHDIDKASDLKKLKLSGSSHTKKYLDNFINF